MAKKIDLYSIVIEKIIVHDIPKNQKNDLSVTPNYSLKESTLTDGLRNFFKDKVTVARMNFPLAVLTSCSPRPAPCKD